MVIIGQRVVKPESPPLTSFLEALQLFADAFESSGGFRLTRVARPPILFYGLYGTTALEDVDRRLLNLIIQRGLLADQLDCFLQCGCTAENIKCQIVLDKILYDVDRAIDLYALGKDDFGEPERRAAAYGFVIQQFIENSGLVNPTPVTQPSTKCFLPVELATIGGTELPLRLDDGILFDIVEELQPDLRSPAADVQEVIDELVLYANAIRTKLTTNETGNDLCVGPDLIDICEEISGLITTDIPPRFKEPPEIEDITNLFRLAKIGEDRLLGETPPISNAPSAPASVNEFLRVVLQELCIQEEIEARWE
jgi:hypothetical protein